MIPAVGTPAYENWRYGIHRRQSGGSAEKHPENVRMTVIAMVKKKRMGFATIAQAMCLTKNQVAGIAYRAGLCSPLGERPCISPAAQDRILEDVATRHGLPVTDLVAASRKSKLVTARHEAMFRLDAAGVPKRRIGRLLGGRDSSSVTHGIRQHQKRLDATPIQRGE